MAISTHRIVRQSTEHECTLYGDIRFYGQYEDLIAGLLSASEDDVIVLKINSGGGNVDVGMMIVQAIKESIATVIARVVWPSASMASIIAMACDSLIIDKHASLMFHTYSAGYGGKSGDMMQQAQTWHECLVNSFEELCTPFLTKKEMAKMHKGEDLYIKWNEPDLYERTKRHFYMVPTQLVEEHAKKTDKKA